MIKVFKEATKSFRGEIAHITTSPWLLCSWLTVLPQFNFKNCTKILSFKLLEHAPARQRRKIQKNIIFIGKFYEGKPVGVVTINEK